LGPKRAVDTKSFARWAYALQHHPVFIRGGVAGRRQQQIAGTRNGQHAVVNGIVPEGVFVHSSDPQDVQARQRQVLVDSRRRRLSTAAREPIRSAIRSV